jgi:hypothetical protein
MGMVAHAVIPALGRQRKENYEVETNLSCIVRSYLKKP